MVSRIGGASRIPRCSVAEIRDEHVEWRVVDRLRELLEKLPDTEHDVTLTYSLFSTIVCWTCQRLRDEAVGPHQMVWQKLCNGLASADPWHFDVSKATQIRIPSEAAVDASLLSPGRFLIGVRNAIAHGDHTRIRPHHLPVMPGGADRRLVGFTITADFDHRRRKDGELVVVKDWGSWQFNLTSMDMRRIGIGLATRFCDGFGKNAQEDAVRHVEFG